MQSLGLGVPHSTIVRRIDGEYAIRRIPDRSLVIESRLAVVEEIRQAVAEGFRAVPRGGLEVGGLLFGRRDGNLIQITAQRPLGCEHAHGPGFILSERDEEALEKMLAAPRSDAGLAELCAVGWYHSHTRSGLALTDRDIELHERFFPEPWQVALLLRPENDGRVRAGFFARDAGGTLGSEPAEEMAVQPYRPSAKERSAREPSIPGAAPARDSTPREGRGQAAPAPKVVPIPEPAAAPAPLAPPRPDRVRPAEEPQRQSVEPPAPRPAPLQRPEVALRREPPERGTWHWGWLALATVSLILAAAFFQDYYRVGQQPARDIVVRAVDAGGQLVISWDRGAELARWARRAVLDVTDGGNRSSFNLDADRVARGTLTYQRRSGEVDVRMRVFGPEGRAIEGLAAFIGQPASAPAAPEAAPPKQPEPDPSEDLKRQLDAAIRERDAALEEAGRLRTAVANQARRNRELEDAIEALRRRLRVESGLRGR